MIKKYRVHDLAKFHYSEIGEYIGENFTDRPLRNDILVDLLNQLNDENEQLKQELCQQEMEYATEYHHLAEENEQLKTKNNAYLQDIEMFKEENTTLKLENEQLKEQNEFLQKRLDCIIQSLQNDLNNYGMMGRCK